MSAAGTAVLLIVAGGPHFYIGCGLTQTGALSHVADVGTKYLASRRFHLRIFFAPMSFLNADRGHQF